MTNEQILKKAMEKAKKNIEEGPEKNTYRYYLEHWDNYIGDSQFKFYIIFSHSFAKAIWGEKIKRRIIICSNQKCKSRENYWWRIDDWEDWKKTPYCQECGQKVHIEERLEKKENWRGHLQQMVLEEEPLKYIEKFL